MEPRYETGNLQVRGWALAALLVLLSGCQSPEPHHSLEAGLLRLELDERGRVIGLILADEGNRHVRPAPLLSIRRNAVWVEAEAAAMDGDLLRLRFPGGDSAAVRLQESGDYVRLELVGLSGTGTDLVRWGPFETDMDEVIGETVGVVQEDGLALGLMALNPETLGGHPDQENDLQRQVAVPIDPPTAWGDIEVRYRVEAAGPTDSGSSLQAYTRDRTRPRTIENRGFPVFDVSPLPGVGLIGSAIALYGARSADVLDVIGRLELAEGLPHPALDGQWIKTHPKANESYVVLEFDEARLDEAVAAVRRAGLRYLYHEEPFSTWGEFTLDPQYFPEGEESLTRMVRRAEAQGVMLGLHTLSNFVTPNDPLVTPIPSEGLQTVGAARLLQGVDARSTRILIDDIVRFPNARRSHLGAARIGSELVRYDSVSAVPGGYVLAGVERGAYGTTAAAHSDGAAVARLDDHAYRVFLAGMTESERMAERLGGMMRRTGVRGMGFDGLGGVHTSGHGKYAENRFVNAWWNALGPDLQNHSINSGSGTTHWYWHIYSRMNWGEPWRGGFREAQLVRRLRQQDYYRRNFMAPMLGWFKMTPVTTLADVEWMLARAAGFDAGFAFVTIYETLEANAATGAILDQVRIWEEARLAGAFPEDMKTALQDVRREFTLEESDTGWVLYPIVTDSATVSRAVNVESDIPDGGWRTLTLTAGPLGLSPTDVTVDGVRLFTGLTLPAAASAVVDHTGTLTVRSATGQTLATEAVGPLPAGPFTAQVSGTMPGGASPASVVVRTRMAGVELGRVAEGVEGGG